jgi:outer membrane protein TolC
MGVAAMNRVKKRFYTVTITVLWVLFLPFAWSSEEKSPVGELPVRTLTEEQAIELAIKNSRKVNAAHVRVRIADAQLESAGGVENPELRVSNLSTRYFTDGFDELELGLRWKPPRLGELPEAEQDARVALWEQRVIAQQERALLVTEVRKAYADLIMHGKLREFARQRIDVETRRIRIVESMTDLGLRSIVYLTKARLWITEAKNLYTLETRRYMDAENELKKLTGVDSELRAVEEELPTVDLPMDALFAIADANRLETRLTKEEEVLAQRRFNLERYSLIPWFSFVEVAYHLENNREDWGELMFGLDLPLFNWNTGNIKAAKIAMQRRAGQTDAMVERIEAALRLANDRYNQALIDYNLIRNDSTTLIETAQRVIDEAQRHTTTPLDEVLELETTILEARMLLCEKRGMLAHALADLYEVLGVEDHSQLVRR